MENLLVFPYGHRQSCIQRAGRFSNLRFDQSMVQGMQEVDDWMALSNVIPFAESSFMSYFSPRCVCLSLNLFCNGILAYLLHSSSISPLIDVKLSGSVPSCMLSPQFRLEAVRLLVVKIIVHNWNFPSTDLDAEVGIFETYCATDSGMQGRFAGSSFRIRSAN